MSDKSILLAAAVQLAIYESGPRPTGQYNEDDARIRFNNNIEAAYNRLVEMHGRCRDVEQGNQV